MSRSHAPAPPLHLAPAQTKVHTSLPQSQSALVLLCFFEAAERFAATALGSVLVLHLTERHGASNGDALRLVGLFQGLCYALPIVGGTLSDRLGRHDIGLRLGALFLVVGYAALGVAKPAALMPLLVLLANGHALFKPNIAALLSQLCVADEQRSGRAFAWFYVAANAGGLLGPLCSGLLLRYVGWPSVCALAASSLAFCMLLTPPRSGPRQSGDLLSKATHRPHDSSPTAIPCVRRIKDVALVLCTLMAAGGGLAQLDGAILLWVRDGIQRQILGMEAPVAWFAALPALLVLLVSPLLSRWDRRAPNHSQVARLPRKIFLGLLCMSLAFVAFALLSLPLASVQRVHMAWLLTAYPLLALGELRVIPALQSRLASRLPTTQAGLAGGLFFASLAAGQWLSGLIGPLWTCIAPSSYFGIWAMLLAAVACLWRRF